MRPYTLHVPADAPIGEPEALDRAVLVPDRFSWGAFVFNGLWLLRYRLWLVGIAVILGFVALQAGLQLAGAHPGAILLAQILLSLLVGLEAASLRRWSLHRRGWPAVDTVMARNVEEAETAAFRRWLDRRPPRLSAPVTGAVMAPARADAGIIGLFPQAERGR